MRINPNTLKSLCQARHIRLKELLDESGVSRTAYYSLVRKDSILPKSVNRIARCLGVSPLRFLSDDAAEVRRMRALQDRTGDICARNPDCDRDVVFRTLLNLELPPVERLRKALIRAPKRHGK